MGRKTKKLLSAFFVIALLFGQAVTAAQEAAVRLETSGDYVRGLRTNFKFFMPKEWRGIVYAESGDVSGAPEAERLDFFCLSDSGKSKPAPLFSLYVFAVNGYKSEFLTKFDGSVVLRTQEYVFAAGYYGAAFESKQDKLIFAQVFEYVQTAEKVRNLITVANETLVYKQVRIYINNAATPYEPVIIDGLYCVPLRAVCEALGYGVNWYASLSTVEVFDYTSNWSDRFKITSKTTADSRGLEMRIINNRTYVHTAYFTRVMKKSVEIDGNGNIFIYG